MRAVQHLNIVKKPLASERIFLLIYLYHISIVLPQTTLPTKIKSQGIEYRNSYIEINLGFQYSVD